MRRRSTGEPLETRDSDRVEEEGLIDRLRDGLLERLGISKEAVPTELRRDDERRNDKEETSRERLGRATKVDKRGEMAATEGVIAAAAGETEVGEGGVGLEREEMEGGGAAPAGALNSEGRDATRPVSGTSESRESGSTTLTLAPFEDGGGALTDGDAVVAREEAALVLAYLQLTVWDADGSDDTRRGKVAEAAAVTEKSWRRRVRVRWCKLDEDAAGAFRVGEQAGEAEPLRACDRSARNEEGE